MIETGLAGRVVVVTGTAAGIGRASSGSEQDLAIPLWAQAKLVLIFPSSRYELVPEAGHVAYLEGRDLFFPRLLRFLAARDPNA